MPTDDLPPDAAPEALTIDAAIELLRHGDKPFPAQAVALLYASREAATAPLLDLLTAAALDPQSYVDDLNDQRLLVAICILTAWEEPAAYQPLLAVLRLPADTLEDLFCDILMEAGGQWLAAVAGSDAGPIAQFVADSTCDQWSRMAALGALVRLVYEDRCPRDTVIGWLADWMADPERLGSREVVAKLTWCARQLGATQLTEQVTALYANRQVALGLYGDLNHMLEGMSDPEFQAAARQEALEPPLGVAEFLHGWWPATLEAQHQSSSRVPEFTVPVSKYLPPAASLGMERGLGLGPAAQTSYHKDPKAKTKRKMAKQSKKRNRGK